MEEAKYILNNPSLSIGTEIVMLVTSIVGLFFNGLAVYIVHYKLKSRNACIWLMSIVGIADILVAIVIIVSEFMKFATNYRILDNNTFCQYSGMFLMLLTMTTIDGVGLISLIRLLSITMNIEIKSIYWYMAMGSVFIYNIVIHILGVVNNIMRVMPSQVYCMAMFAINDYAKTFAILFLTKFVVMIFIIMFSYICITITYCRIISPLNSKYTSNECFIGNSCSVEFQKSIVFKLLSLIIMYAFCFFPQLITVLYNVATNTSRTPYSDAVIGITMNLTVLVNAAFVLFYQKEARKAILSMIPNWICSDNRSQKCMAMDDFDI
ncbi:hypothetical protein CONCODRAFT_6771 [Conidiobolus coronatus NRRL 28638]|uniref:G-protein coupled receptors family 1 profile domain-containing protein n=1 Tax=Conidiobolus coronatus (strain ATCC 28846 / CBS 209.66 / NRRL 28638) TaxID=796925 RepID=A0A137P6H3_CONC2|nr:hypothetical protein CONCODRAFT_6771 [Conidiobolus coronatus NRRL 28638]|eukprot:KXN70606.1 hypothetical protein CONCODRAFT_6771 [Conidiobolus coronatus NRRL 28638]